MADPAHEQNEGVLAFSQVEEGWRAEVIGFGQDGRQAQRLAELGFTPGAVARVIRNARNQPLLVCVRGTRLAIDRETAETLNVRLLDRRQRRPGFWRRRAGRRERRRDGRRG